MLIKTGRLFIKKYFTALKASISFFNSIPAYELINILSCPKADKYMVEVKVTGKSQSFFCYAEKIVNDDTMLAGFLPQDIRTITYLATKNAFSMEFKEKKYYEIIHSKNANGDKIAHLKNIINNETIVISLKDLKNCDLIDKLDPKDAYQIGYLAGQEQTWKDFSRLKVVQSGK